ncbi:MAG: hypothetical protein MUC92_04705 [Fimbriimonadaceae bacterium]|jgi:hypothetical protein|nr:hypothetical protein [Fimbriimonadaceae bacterium]
MIFTMRTKISLLAFGALAALALQGCGGFFGGSGGSIPTPPSNPDTYGLQALATFTNANQFPGETTNLTASLGSMSQNATHRVFSFGPTTRRMSVAIPDRPFFINGARYPVQEASQSSLGGMVGLQLPGSTVYEGSMGTITLTQATTGSRLVFDGSLQNVVTTTPGDVESRVELDLPTLTVLPANVTTGWGAVYEHDPATQPQVHKTIFRNTAYLIGGTMRFEVEFTDGDKLLFDIPGVDPRSYLVGNGTDPLKATATYSDLSGSIGYGSTTMGKVHYMPRPDGLYLTFEDIRFSIAAPVNGSLSGVVRIEQE